MMTMSNSHDTQKRLAIYSAIAGVLAVGTAQAAPTESPLSFPISLVDSTDNNGGLYADIDIDNSGQIDYRLYVDFNTNCTYNNGFSYFSGQYGGGIEISQGSYAGMIAAGTPVSGAMSFSSFSVLQGCYSAPGNFPTPSRGFVAVSFMNGNNLHYGYLDVETFAGSAGVSVLSACYESLPNTEIEAGACDSRGPARPVPVGGLIPLTLGVLAIGAAALRRRRRQI